MKPWNCLRTNRHHRGKMLVIGETCTSGFELVLDKDVPFSTAVLGYMGVEIFVLHEFLFRCAVLIAE